MKKAILIILIFTILLLAGCKSFDIQEDYYLIYKLGKVTERYDSVQMYKRYKKGNRKPETVFKIRKNSKGELWGEITSDLLSNAKIIGDVEKLENGDMELSIDSIYFLVNWVDGWTEGEMEAYGKIIFKLNEAGLYNIEIAEPLELFNIVKGQVRFRGDYYREDEGLKKVKHRTDRILELVKFLKKHEFDNYYGHLKWKNGYGESFRKSIKSLLFPETLAKKPQKYKVILQEYQDKITGREDSTSDMISDKNDNPAIDDDALDMTSDNTDLSSDVNKKDEAQYKWSIGYGKLWSTVYTRKVFPEHLHKVRDSGSMWLDYEEAGGLIMLFYNLDYYYNDILKETELVK